MEISARQTLPHYEYDTMEVTIEPWTNEVRLDIEVKDGYGDKNSRVSMSLEDFDRIADTVHKYRLAAASVAVPPNQNS